MISAFLSSAGRMVRAGIIVGLLMSAVALMVVGAKVSGWFTDAQQIARSHELDEREAAIKALDKATQDKREAELTRRETALFALAPKEAAKVADAQIELARVKADTARLEEIAKKYAKQAAEAQKRADEATKRAAWLDAPAVDRTASPVVAPRLSEVAVAAPVAVKPHQPDHYTMQVSYYASDDIYKGYWATWDECVAAVRGSPTLKVGEYIKSIHCVPFG